MENKKRLIDVDRVIFGMQKVIDERTDDKDTVAYKTFEAVIAALKKEPTVDAMEVIHGEWRCVSLDPQDPYFVCSNCKIGYSTIYHECEDMKYCPNCGAKMDK